MSDFDLSLIIKGDGKEAVAAGNDVADTIKEVGTAAQSTTQKTANLEKGSRSLAAAQAEAMRATTTLGGAMGATAKSADVESVAQAKLGKALSDTAKSSAAAELAQVKLKQAQDKLSQSSNGVAKSNGQLKASQLSLGQQFSDFSTQILSGGNAFTAFAQQSGQAAYALNGFGGTLGKVGAFLNGPYGIALTIAISTLGVLGSRLYAASEAADTAGKANKTLQQSVEDLDRATGLANKSYETTIANLKAETEAKLRNAIATRTQIAAELSRQQAIANATVNTGAPRGEGPNAGAAFAQDVAGNRAADLSKQLAKNAADILSAQTSLAGVATSAIIRSNKANLDPAIAATQKYEKALESLRAEYARSGKTDADRAEFQRKELDLEKQLAVGKSATSDARKAASAATKEENKAIREAAAANRQLDTDLKSVQDKFLPAAKSAREYAEALAQIARLRDAGRLSAADANIYGIGVAREQSQRDFAASKASIAGVDFGVPTLSEQLKEQDQQKAAAKEIADYFRKEGVKAAKDIGDSLKSVVGTGVGGFLGKALTAAQGGSKGSILGGLLGGKDGNGVLDSASFLKGSNSIKAAITTSIGGLGKSLLGKLGSIFGAGGSFGADISNALGAAGAALKTGAEIAQLGKAIGVKTSTTGGALGGLGGLGVAAALGAGPIGLAAAVIAGGVLGAVGGGLLKPTKQGSATLTSATGDFSVAGNSNKAIKAASELAGNVASGLGSIASQLGGQLGAFNVTVGQRHGDYRVTTGTSLKTANGAKEFNDDATAATAYAIQLAVSQGAVKGLSEAVQKALKSSSDIDAALAEALKVKDLQTLLGGLGSSLAKTFSDFDTVAAERVRLAKSYGLDLLAVEKLNATERADLLDKTLKARVSALADFLDQVKFGDLFEGSADDRRNALKEQIAAILPDALAGKDGASDKLSSLQGQLLSTSRDAFGTAGINYASDRAQAISSVEQVIAMENKRVADAAAQQQNDSAALQTANTLTDETNGLLAISNTTLSSIDQNLALLAAAGGVATASNTARSSSLK